MQLKVLPTFVLAVIMVNLESLYKNAVWYSVNFGLEILIFTTEIYFYFLVGL